MYAAVCIFIQRRSAAMDRYLCNACLTAQGIKACIAPAAASLSQFLHVCRVGKVNSLTLELDRYDD